MLIRPRNKGLLRSILLHHIPQASLPHFVNTSRPHFVHTLSTQAGWDLACKLIRPRDKGSRRGRLSAGQALSHRYFLPEF